ncbi:MAG TPA: YbhB/YbcL family Raf kinase inhibitor-like protein [Candidatus Acidoferrales bacterium]|nr:YbhB/YbcL family Raf kinase inhibitor-like protein [Candidatus Acidoferrales bacterium]
MRVQDIICVLIALFAVASQAAAASFSLTSSAFANGGAIPHIYIYSGASCDGQNASPPLAWTPGPDQTKSYALTVFDPDARNGVGWWHWVMFDIPPDVTKLPKGAGNGSGAYLPQGAIQGRNDFQNVGWSGPCPPPGPAHHYVFTLYALDMSSVPGTSELTAGPTLLRAIAGHVLAKTTLVGRYGR